MIRRPALLRSSRGTRTSIPASVPAPIGGWNTRDPIAAMRPTDALWLENWWPDTGDVSVRKGASYHVTGITGKVESLMTYRSATATKLFGATSSAIYDVTAAGDPAVSVKAVTSGRFQYTHFSPVEANYLVAVNGVDPLQLYNGTAWASIDDVSVPGITGLPTSSLSNLCVFKRRLWFVEKQSMSAWYLPVDQVGGVLAEFPVGQLFSRGGHLVAINSWTIDGGSGPDDYLVLLTSAGELAVYAGTDPSSSTTFNLIGVYFIGEPLGAKSLLRMGGDLLVLTQAGAFPLSKSYQSSILNHQAAISDKINKVFAQAAEAYKLSYGWAPAVFPNEHALVVNVPTKEGEFSQQFVMNTITNSWALFSGWNALCWESTEEGIFFGGDGYVAKAFSGTDDFGESIISYARSAFTYLGSHANKSFKLFRPVIHATDDTNIDFGIDVNFNDVESSNFVQQGIGAPTGVPAPSNPLSTFWDNAVWDTAVWGADSNIKSYWWTAFGSTGFCLAVRLRIISKGVILGWSSTDFLYQRGSGL